MEQYEIIEKSITTTYRKRIWKQFIKAICDFDMIQDGDKIAVCISGGKDSMLLAKCMQELKKHKKMNFEVVFISMNPGYNEINKNKILDNSKLLNIPLSMFEAPIFNSVENIEDNPCYICARMRRGYLYEEAKRLGCNKIALGHHFNDVIETILMSIFYGSQFQTMMPKLKSTSHPGMELIRPLYFVREEDIICWKNKNNLEFISCACRLTANKVLKATGESNSKREEMKQLIKNMKEFNPNIEKNIYNSTQNVNLTTLISYHKNDGNVTSFLDNY